MPTILDFVAARDQGDGSGGIMQSSS